MRHPGVKINVAKLESLVEQERNKSDIIAIGEFIKHKTGGRITYNSYRSARVHGYVKRQKVIDALKEFYPECFE